MPIGPREKHVLEQFLAWNTEVQARLKAFEEGLLEMGYSKAEAWAIARDLEERILGPMMDYTERAAKVEEEIDTLIRKRLEELEDE